MNCPKCNQNCCEELAEEVDIGVGIQKHVFGYECEACGQFSVCNNCGAIEGVPHASWCHDFKTKMINDAPL